MNHMQKHPQRLNPALLHLETPKEAQSIQWQRFRLAVLFRVVSVCVKTTYTGKLTSRTQLNQINSSTEKKREKSSRNPLNVTEINYCPRRNADDKTEGTDDEQHTAHKGV